MEGLKVTDQHGATHLAAEHLADAGFVQLKDTITAASVAADGTVTVDFNAKKLDGTPVTDLNTSVPAGVSVPITVAATVTYLDATNNWVPYFWSTESVSATSNPTWVAGEAAAFTHNGVANTNVVGQGTTSNTTITNLGGGNYRAVLAKKLVGQTRPSTNSTKDLADGSAITYDPTRTHRIGIGHGGHNGYTANAEFDIVPAGGALPQTRNIVSTTACNQCHVTVGLHGGGRQRIEYCVTCHNPSTFDSSSDSTMDAKVLFHKIHMGSSLTKGYKIGHRGNTMDYSHIGFPAEANTCEKCHYQPAGETLADVDKWKTNPTRVACGSCHDGVDFATGVGHAGGAMLDDKGCTYCHASSGTQTTDGQSPAPVPDVHYSANKAKLTPEYTADITVSGDGGDGKFDKTESPKLTIVIKKNGVAIDHSTMTRDSGTVGATDLKWKALGLYVNGPRAKRMPVLTTTARAALTSSAGPFNIINNGTLTFLLDGGGVARLTGSDGFVTDVSGTVTVTLPCGATGNKIASCSAATAAEIATALNANAAFKARAKAEASADGKLSVWSRNVSIGSTYATQVTAGTAATALGFDPTKRAALSGSTPGNSLFNANLASGAIVDPKATFSAANITYQLDSVDDLIAAGRNGTYNVRLEFSDYGRISDTDYIAPSFGRAVIQVGTATEEKLVADSCNRCHRDGNDKGLAKDPARHNVTLNNFAADNCGSCHDYQTDTGAPADGWSGWNGAKPLSRRLHGLHNSAGLTDRKTTIGYSGIGSHPNWDHVTIPTDVRNCEVCHSSNTSGSWKSNPNRVACAGCHDSEAAKSHYGAMTYDPTP